MAANLPQHLDPGSRGTEARDEASSLIDMMMQQARNSLDDVAEPSLEDLVALDGVDELDDLELNIDVVAADAPALSLLAELDAPELVSLEGLDDVDEADAHEEDLQEGEELLDDVEGLIDDYIDVELDDDELEDEGYDLDDDDVGNYRDLYGDDDAIIPSFREGEFAEDEENDTAYYDDLR